nr:Os06g0549950 [Ipomoea batatas]
MLRCGGKARQYNELDQSGYESGTMLCSFLKKILWDCWKHRELSKRKASEAMRDASEPRLGRLRPIQWRNKLHIGPVDVFFFKQFQHPLENLGGKGAFGIVGLDLEAPLFEIEGAGFGNVEYRDGFRHGNQFQFPGEYDAEASASAAPDSPEEILPHGFPVQDSPVNIHDSGVNHVVRRQPIFSQQHPVPAAADVATRAHRGTNTRRKS